MDLPIGHNVFGVLYKQDPASGAFKIFVTISTCVVCFCLLPVLTLATTALFPDLDASFDQRHGVQQLTGNFSFKDAERSIDVLFSNTFGISPYEWRALLGLTAMLFGLLFCADLANCRWPASWHTENRLCYEAMFSEPTRRNRLVKHCGNTYSNFFYVLAGLCVLASAYKRQALASTLPGPDPLGFLLVDVIFGVFLFLLGVTSVIWHASNAPKSHYTDLFFMDGCIFYLVVRTVGISSMIAMRWAMDDASAIAYSSWLCTVLLVVVLRGIWKKHVSGNLFSALGEGAYDNGCPVSGRQRILNKDKPGNDNLTVLESCLFMGLPVLLWILPTLAQVLLTRSVGSVLAATASQTTVAIGWNLRMGERFVVDGWPPMRAVMRMCSKSNTPAGSKGHPGHDAPLSPLGTVCAAVVSPTAILHFFTGLALIFAYVHMRSIEVDLYARFESN